MSATILTQLTDQGIQLSNAAGARQLGVGTSWNRLRVGARVCITDSGINLSGTPRFYLGVQAGAVNNPLSGSAATHFVGLITSSGNWTRSGSTYSVASGPFYGKQVGTAISTVAVNVTTVFPWNTYRLYVSMIEITKGSPNFTLQVLTVNNINASPVPFANFIAGMETSSFAGVPAAIGTGSLVAQPAAGIAVNEGTDGQLDSVSIAWDRSSVEVFFADVAYAVFS